MAVLVLCGSLHIHMDTFAASSMIHPNSYLEEQAMETGQHPQEDGTEFEEYF